MVIVVPSFAHGDQSQQDAVSARICGLVPNSPNHMAKGIDEERPRDTGAPWTRAFAGRNTRCHENLLRPSTSEEIANRAGLNERDVHEWLGTFGDRSSRTLQLKEASSHGEISD